MPSNDVYRIPREAQLLSLAGQLVPIFFAFSAWVAMNPYFLWNAFVFGRPGNIVLSLGFALLGVLLMAAGRSYQKPDRFALLGLSAISLFLVYVTAQPRIDGGHTKWIFAIILLWGVGLLSSKSKARAFAWFATFFALSVLPGVLVSLWMTLGLPITFTRIPAANPVMAESFVWLLYVPGALFTESNVVMLSYGGTLFRLNAIFDEPGMVGTMAAFLLAAYRFRLSGWKPVLIYAAGLLSGSLAFVVLAGVGFVAAGVLARRWESMGAIAPIALMACLIFGWTGMKADLGSKSSVIVQAVHMGDKEVAAVPVQDRGQELRAGEAVDNRMLGDMKDLLREYLAASPAVLLFGIASDASVVKAPTSQVWARVLTNHGILGFVLLFAGFAALAWSAWQASGRSEWIVLFCVLFVASFYQRPVIWLPYPLLLFLCIPSFISQAVSKKIYATDSTTKPA